MDLYSLPSNLDSVPALVLAVSGPGLKKLVAPNSYLFGYSLREDLDPKTRVVMTVKKKLLPVPLVSSSGSGHDRESWHPEEPLVQLPA